MRVVTVDSDLFSLLTRFQEIGGEVEYVFLAAGDETPPENLHRDAALAGMAEIYRRNEWHYPDYCDETKAVGSQVSFAEFMGTEEIAPMPIPLPGVMAWSVPETDGYCTAFFNPPHGLGGKPGETAQLFESINKFVFGNDPNRTEIVSWSTNWSMYFEPGLEWWGAFFWTIRQLDSDQMVVIAASTTD